MIIGHTLNEGGGPNFFNSARESWTDTDLRRELARRPTPLPAGVVEGLRNAYPNAKPVEIYVHTVNQGGLGYRIDSIRAAAPGRRESSVGVLLHLCVEDLGHGRTTPCLSPERDSVRLRQYRLVRAPDRRYFRGPDDGRKGRGCRGSRSRGRGTPTTAGFPIGRSSTPSACLRCFSTTSPWCATTTTGSPEKRSPRPFSRATRALPSSDRSDGDASGKQGPAEPTGQLRGSRRVAVHAQRVHRQRHPRAIDGVDRLVQPPSPAARASTASTSETTPPGAVPRRQLAVGQVAAVREGLRSPPPRPRRGRRAPARSWPTRTA